MIPCLGPRSVMTHLVVFEESRVNTYKRHLEIIGKH